MKKKEEVIARLTINNLPTMTEKRYRRLLVWLEAQFENFQRGNLKDYSKKFTARLIK